MGKGGKKKKKSKGGFDVNDIFDSTKPASAGNDDGWHSGVSAMALDGCAAEGGAGAALSATAAGEAMDTADFLPFSKSGLQGGLKLQKSSMKIAKRGNRTTIQKKRKTAKQEKALAHAEKSANRASGKVKRKQQVAALKTLY